VTFLRSLWLDAVIGWNQGAAIKARAKAEKANARAVRAQAAWNDLNPHPFNQHVCLIHMTAGAIRCPNCPPLAEEAS
jgi:hypothetical protein